MNYYRHKNRKSFPNAFLRSENPLKLPPKDCHELYKQTVRIIESYEPCKEPVIDCFGWNKGTPLVGVDIGIGYIKEEG